MAVATPRKSPRKNPPAVSADISARAALAAQVDELGLIEAQLEPHRAAITREEALRKAIRGFFDQGAGQSCEASGRDFVAVLGARTLQSTINTGKLVELIGAEKFATFATTTLAALEKHAPAADVVTKAATGPRSLTIVRRQGGA